jgi:hypothetical protein
MAQYGGRKEWPVWEVPALPLGVTLNVAEVGPLQWSPEQKRLAIEVWSQEMVRLGEDVRMVGKVLRGLSPDLGKLQPRLRGKLRCWELEFFDTRLGKEGERPTPEVELDQRDYQATISYRKNWLNDRNLLRINGTQVLDAERRLIRPRNGHEERLLWPAVIGHELGHALHLNFTAVANEAEGIDDLRMSKIWNAIRPIWLIEGMASSRHTGWRQMGELLVPGIMPVSLGELSKISPNPGEIRTLLENTVYANGVAVPEMMSNGDLAGGKCANILNETLFLSVLGLRLGKHPRQFLQDWYEIGQEQAITKTQLAEMNAVDVHRQASGISLFGYFGDEVAKMMVHEWDIMRRLSPYVNNMFPEGNFSFNSDRVAQELHGASVFGFVNKTFIEELAGARMDFVLYYGEMLMRDMMGLMKHVPIQHPLTNGHLILDSVCQRYLV